MRNKIIAISLAILVLPLATFAYFRPATLTNGVERVAVFSEEQANRLFANGYTLEGEKVGAFSNPNFMFDAIFHKSIKFKEGTRSIAKTSVTSTTTLTALDSGTTFYLSASGTTINLPSVTSAAGVVYKFVVKGALDSGNVLITSAEGDNIEGALIVAGAVVDCDANDVVTFVVDGENLGDFVELRSDGTKWFIGASGALTASKLTCSG